MSNLSDAVDGHYIVLADRTALPQRCILTNQPVTDNEYRSYDLPWIPGWAKASMIFFPLLLIFLPFAVRHRCRIKAGLSRSIHLRYSIRKLSVGVILLATMVAPFCFMIAEKGNYAVASVVLSPFLLWGGLIVGILFSSPLKIIKQGRDLFWIKGCSPAFLGSLENSLEVESPATA